MKTLPIIALFLTLAAFPASATQLFKSYSYNMPIEEAAKIDQAFDCSAQTEIPGAYCIESIKFAGTSAAMVLNSEEGKLKSIMLMADYSEENIRALSMALHSKLAPIAYESDAGFVYAKDLAWLHDNPADRNAELLQNTLLYTTSGGRVTFLDPKYSNASLANVIQTAPDAERITQIIGDIENMAVYIQFQTIGLTREQGAVEAAAVAEDF